MYRSVRSVIDSSVTNLSQISAVCAVKELIKSINIWQSYSVMNLDGLLFMDIRDMACNTNLSVSVVTVDCSNVVPSDNKNPTWLRCTETIRTTSLLVSFSPTSCIHWRSIYHVQQIQLQVTHSFTETQNTDRLKQLQQRRLLGRPVPPFRTGLCFTGDVSFFCFATRSPSSLNWSPWNFSTWSESGWIL